MKLLLIYVFPADHTNPLAITVIGLTDGYEGATKPVGYSFCGKLGACYTSGEVPWAL